MSRDKSTEAWLASLSKEELIDQCFLWRDAALETGRKYNSIRAEKLALCKRINELCVKVEQLRKTATMLAGETK